MKMKKLALFAASSAMALVACSDDASSSVSPEENNNSPVIPDSGYTCPDGSVVSDVSLCLPVGSSDSDYVGSSASEYIGSSASLESSSSVDGVIPSSSSVAPVVQSSDSEDGTDLNDEKSLDGTETLITVSGTSSTIQNDNGCLTQGDKKLTITCSGDYYFTGTGSDYQVLVNVASAQDTGNVDVYLNNLDMTSSDAPFNVINAERTVFHLVKGTANKLADGTSRVGFTKVDGTLDTADAVISAKDDITFKGAGSLTLTSNYLTAQDTGSGIKSSNDIKIKNGDITITAQNNGIKGKGSVHVSGGSLNITTKYGDGIKSDADEASDLAAGKGLVEITGGIVNVTSAFDGISATNKLVVAKNEDGSEPSITIVTGNGQTCLSSSSTSSGMGGFGGMSMQDGNSCKSDSDPSRKGMKADSLILISGGTIDIDAQDDAIHGSNVVTIEGGNITVKSDDDGVHAEDSLNINGGYVSIKLAYEGFEGGVITANGGVTSLYVTDDGWNASASAATTSTSTGGWNRGGMGGMGGPGGNSTGTMIINGGYHYVSNGSGDTDGIDSNGDIYFHGGVMVIEAGGNGTDKGDNGNSLTLDGGVLIVFASQVEGTGGTCVSTTASNQQLTVVQNNAVVASYTPSSNNTVRIMTKGEANIYTGGTVTGDYVTFPYNGKNLYYSGSIANGTAVSANSCSSSGSRW